MSAACVLLTRPRKESRETARTLAARGIGSIRMPLQATRRAPASARLAADLAFAGGASIQIFVSRAAVAAAAALAPSQLAAAGTRIAVGAATAAALERLGLSSVRTPGHAEDSEGILGLPVLQSVAGMRIAIWAAPGGRDRMATELALRGAEVRALMVYRRIPLRPRQPALRRLRLCPQAVVLSASSGLLLQALDAALARHRLTALRERPLIVASARIAALAAGLGYHDVRIARGASAQALAEALGRTPQPQA
ncbi:MAG: uroporphyrinogen-III synthase [Rhodanobacteraceae bacterium]|nr:uroporphyrinogen-III synthase [Rhodanobacteraceae bacterium]